MRKKIRVALFFGGRSAEHEVSIRSAKNIYEAIDQSKYEVILCGIDTNGQFVLNIKPQLLFADKNHSTSLPSYSLSNESMHHNEEEKGMQLLDILTNSVDVIFPVLHGPYGEDGTIQGFCKILNIPFVGPDVLGSAVGMDKDVAKRLMRDSGIPIADFLVFTKNDCIDYDNLVEQLGSPFFIKPANLGSSVGVSKVINKNNFEKAVHEAFKYDRKIIIEEAITGREIECSVLGNEAPIASAVGEVIPTGHEFYDYDAKYIDDTGAQLIIPAEIPQHVAVSIQKMAVSVFQILSCEGMARVDFFVTKNEKIYVNEINTIPGFTNISMFPKLWELSGIPYSELIEQLIELALRRHKRDSLLKTTRESP